MPEMKVPPPMPSGKVTAKPMTFEEKVVIASRVHNATKPKEVVVDVFSPELQECLKCLRNISATATIFRYVLWFNVILLIVWFLLSTITS